MSPFNEEQPLSPSEPVAPFPSPSTRPRPRDTIGRLFASYDSDDEGDIENPFEVSGFDHIATVSHPLSEDLPNNHQQPPLSTTRASSTTSSSLKEPWSPPPRSTSTTSARAPPSSSSSGGGQQHLRQRSIPSSRGVRSNDNPFADTYGNQVMRERERGREPPNAAMLDDHGLERAVHTSAASTAMRGGNAEWVRSLFFKLIPLFKFWLTQLGCRFRSNNIFIRKLIQRHESSGPIHLTQVQITTLCEMIINLNQDTTCPSFRRIF